MGTALRINLGSGRRLARSVSALIHPRAQPYEHSLRALALALYPCHFFFSFLFYTDVAALAAALLVLQLVLKVRRAPLLASPLPPVVALQRVGASETEIYMIYNIGAAFLRGPPRAFS